MVRGIIKSGSEQYFEPEYLIYVLLLVIEDLFQVNLFVLQFSNLHVGENNITYSHGYCKE